ncbi:MAG: hypothetical protein U0744_08990 [Gemmataceae bacterium]
MPYIFHIGTSIMDFFRKPPAFLENALPQGARDSWTIIAIAVVALGVLLLLGL